MEELKKAILEALELNAYSTGELRDGLRDRGGWDITIDDVRRALYSLKADNKIARRTSGLWFVVREAAVRP